MKVAASDGVKVYNVSSGKSVPEWLSEGKKRSLRKDEEYRRRLELIQDFEFPAAAHCLRATPDGKYIYASGIHPPRVRCFDVSQLSMKFERHLDSEIVDFEVLSDDYAKLAFLCADRSVAFHAKFGAYHRTRVPRAGRALAYVPHTADLLVAGSAPEIYRLNLEEGRFQTPLASRSPGVNRVAVSPLHGLVAAAGEEGLLECFDARQERCAGRIDAAAAAGGAGQALTSVAFDSRGLQCAVGTSGGLVALFDLRSSRPVLVKDHMYGAPVHSLAFHEPAADVGLGGRRVVSADKHIVRVWDADSGKGFTSVQPPQGAVNDVLLWPGSGLLLLACDAPKLQAYFVPALGPAPAWCSFLESLTEELEESATPTVYDDYRFVTRGELDALGMGHLVGTPLLRAYMHGFFVHNKLWQKARAIARPADLAGVRRERIQARLEAERQQRITLKRRLPKVNAGLAAKLLEEEATAAGGAEPAEEGGERRKRAKPAAGSGLLADERFSSIFTDPAFAIDEQAEEYRLLHPNADRKRDKRLVAEHFAAVDSGDEGGDASEASEASGSGSDSDDEAAARPSRRQQPRAAAPAQPAATAGQPRMLAAKSQAAADAFLRQESLAAARSMPLGERPERQAADRSRQGGRVGGQREMTFFPRGRGRGGGRGRGSGSGGDREHSREERRGGERERERAPGSSQGGGRGGGRGRGRGRGRSASRARGGRGGDGGRGGRGRGRGRS